MILALFEYIQQRYVQMHTILTEKPQKDATVYQNFIIPYFK